MIVVLGAGYAGLVAASRLYFHQCVSLGRRDAVIQFVNSADESPRRAILKGRLAVAYKNIVLSSAIWLFRRPGPYLSLRKGGSARAHGGGAELPTGISPRTHA
jgi:hypothetical protein